MMTLLLTVFIFSVVGMLVMVIRKAIAIKGLPEKPAKPFILDATPHPHRIRRFLMEIGKEGVHIILLTFTKVWLIIGKEWKKMVQKYFPKVYGVFYSEAEIGERKESSFFLATITEYKEKTRRLRERILKEDTRPKRTKNSKTGVGTNSSISSNSNASAKNVESNS